MYTNYIYTDFASPALPLDHAEAKVATAIDWPVFRVGRV